MPVEKRRLPHLGELSVAIIEHLVEKIIGETGIAKIKEPLIQKRLEESLNKALQRTEKRFIDELGDNEICTIIFSLPVSDLPSFKEALWNFYQRPTDVKLSQILWSQLTPYNFSEERLEKATNKFIDILQEELIVSVPEIRQALNTLANVDINRNILRVLHVLEKIEQQIYPPANIAVSKQIINFDTLIAERTKSFVGRTFVVDAIDSFIQENQSGYFIFKGDPGIGKTAFLSQYIKTHSLIHHFNVVQQNIRSPYQFITNICSQLIVRYDLRSLSIPTPEEMEDGVFLMKCLEYAIEKIPHQPLVIALDSLDEANWRALPSGVNVHYLPYDLPQGVYFIVTTRSDKKIPLDVANPLVFHLRQDNVMNKLDIQEYVKNYAKRKKMKALLLRWQIKTSIFVDRATDKCQGNFMYLRHVLPALEKGQLIIDGVEQLPIGLEAYYQRHWNDMQIKVGGKFKESHERVICILGAMPEAVPLETLAEWTKLSLNTIREIRNAWEPFLFDELTNGEQRYRIYHRSFSEFLGKKVDLQIYKEMVAKAIMSKIESTIK